MDAIEQLQQLGFGEYEARAYATLLQHSPLTGYELAKRSGIPRANIYTVLGKLEERGAAVRLATGGADRPALYAPVEPDELLQRLGHRYQEVLDAVGNVLGDLAQPAAEEPVWNLHGPAAVVEHAGALVAAARENLLVALGPIEAAALARDLAEAEGRGVEITIFCLRGCPGPCGHCRGQIHAYSVETGPGTRWLAVVQDGTEAVVGQIGPDGEGTAVRSRQRPVVDLVTWYVRHSIALAAILSDLGSEASRALRPETLAVLRTQRPTAGETGWLARLADISASLPAGPEESSVTAPAQRASVAWQDEEG